ncbi:YciI family protein [Planomonospora venezuelensis]|nr:YciI family protein [Planomonospora venezuelensis]
MIMLYGSQRDYDAMAGRPADPAVWSAEDVAAMHAFMEKWNGELVESGEFVDAQGLTAPVHARRIRLENGVPVVTDGPYAETQEVLAGYTLVECESFDRATEIAARLADTPHPESAVLTREWYVDVRPVAGGYDELEA